MLTGVDLEFCSPSNTPLGSTDCQHALFAILLSFKVVLWDFARFSCRHVTLVAGSKIISVTFHYLGVCLCRRAYRACLFLATYLADAFSKMMHIGSTVAKSIAINTTSQSSRRLRCICTWSDSVMQHAYWTLNYGFVWCRLYLLSKNE